MSNWRVPAQARQDDMEGVASNLGTSVASGAANTKGTPTSLGAAAYDWDGFWLSWGNTGGGFATILDLSVDSGANNLLISNFYLPMSWNLGNQGGGSIQIPIPVLAGTTVYGRIQSSGASQSIRFSLIGCKGGWGAPQRFARAVGLGNNLSTTAPAQVVGSGGTWSSYAQIVSSTADHYGAFIVSPDNNKNSNTPTAQELTLTLGVGASGSEQTLAILRGAFPGVVYQVRPSTWGTIFVDVPAETRLAAKGDAATTTLPNNQLGLSVLGLVA